MTKKEFIEKIDAYLKDVRKEYGFTQEKMAAALGISKKTLVEIEKGRRTLGWTGAVALAVVCGESVILQTEFGGEMSELITALAFADTPPHRFKTLGGKVWWRDVLQKGGFRLQQNILSGHYRLLDRGDCRVMSSFHREEAEECLASLLAENELY